VKVSVTPDGVANDGEPDELDNVMPDVENSLLPPSSSSGPRSAPDQTASSITGIRVNTNHISPNGDGRQDAFSIVARFAAPTQWTFEVMSGSSVIFSQSGAGKIMRTVWNGLTGAATRAVSGRYTWRITTKYPAGNALPAKTGKVVVDRKAPRVRSLRVSRGGRVSFFVSKAATVSARVVGVRRLATVKVDQPGKVALSWNHRNRRAKLVRPGSYRLVIVVTDLAGNVTVRRATITV